MTYRGSCCSHEHRWRGLTRAHTHTQLWEAWHGARRGWVDALSGDTTWELMGMEAPATQKNVPGKHRASHVRGELRSCEEQLVASGFRVSRDVLFKGVDGPDPTEPHRPG